MIKNISICLLLGLVFVATSCNKKTRNATKGNSEFTTKSADGVAYPAVKDYADVKPKGDGRMLSSRELADKICFCSYELTRMNEDIKRYHRNNDKNSLARVRSKTRAAQAKFDKCMAKLKADYPMAIMENLADDVVEQIKKQCPGLVELMDAGHKKMKREQR